MPHSEADPTSRDSRAYFRVRTHIPLRFRQLDPDEIDAMAAEIYGQPEDSEVEIEPALALWFDRLERKLDRILRALGESDTEDVGKSRTVVLSGAGMRFACDAKERDFTGHLLIDFELPGHPRHVVRCIGRSLSARDDGESDMSEDSLAVEFVTLREADRDAIVQHTLDVQRAELRRRRVEEPRES